ncbi:hypothetical protein BH10PSE6_BH10PSE6_40790 [soil metagenome]
MLTHWDDFFKPHDDGLKPMPWPLDRFDKAVKAIIERAGTHTAIAFMPLYESIDIMQVAGGCGASRVP